MTNGSKQRSAIGDAIVGLHSYQGSGCFQSNTAGPTGRHLCDEFLRSIVNRRVQFFGRRSLRKLVIVIFDTLRLAREGYDGCGAFVALGVAEIGQNRWSGGMR
jgi:hypothetical protein